MIDLCLSRISKVGFLVGVVLLSPLIYYADMVPHAFSIVTYLHVRF